jgi:hypothetical protein
MKKKAKNSNKVLRLSTKVKAGLHLNLGVSLGGGRG